MHVCIIGSGAAGWQACNLFKNKSYVHQITIVGSPHIPSIGVGESTTIDFCELHDKIGDNLSDFIRETDAAVKYGVYYKNWSEKNWLHHLKCVDHFRKYNINIHEYGKRLGSKGNVYIHDLIGKFLFQATTNNHILSGIGSKPSQFLEYPNSWHFDAGKYIKYLKKLALNNNKVSFIEDTIVDCVFDGDTILEIISESGKRIQADYYINTSGATEKTNKIFKQEYNDLSDVLLTDKALFYPLKYEDKKKQFHPYTVAKTMKYGWRWITPTWSRIGTGYAFSSKHISVDQAVDEFIKDIGDETIVPNVVDFHPKYNKVTYRKNSCSAGMANGFLEPLDAPGLALTSYILFGLEDIFERGRSVEDLNDYLSESYKWWACFILAQYKTCHRNDTDFWIDHKNVNYDFYQGIADNLGTELDSTAGGLAKTPWMDMMMFYHTMSAKNLKWNSEKPFEVLSPAIRTVNHYTWISQFHSAGVSDA